MLCVDDNAELSGLTPKTPEPDKDPNHDNLVYLRNLKNDKPPARKLNEYVTNGFLKSAQLKKLLDSNGYLCEGFYYHTIAFESSTAFMYVNLCLKPRDINAINGDANLIQAKVWHSDEIIILSKGEPFSSLRYDSRNGFSPKKSGKSANSDFTRQLLGIASISKLKHEDDYYKLFNDYNYKTVLVVTSYGGDNRILSAIHMNAIKKNMTQIAIITSFDIANSLVHHSYHVLKVLDTTTIMIRDVQAQNRPIINENMPQNDMESIHMSMFDDATGKSPVELNSELTPPDQILHGRSKGKSPCRKNPNISRGKGSISSMQKRYREESSNNIACKVPRSKIDSSKKQHIPEDTKFYQACDNYLFYQIPNKEDIDFPDTDENVEAICKSDMSSDHKANLVFLFITTTKEDDDILSLLITVCNYVKEKDDYEVLHELVKKILNEMKNVSIISSFIMKLIYLTKYDGNNGDYGCYSSAFYYMVKCLSNMHTEAEINNGTHATETLNQFDNDADGYILLAVIIYKIKVEKSLTIPMEFYSFIAKIPHSSVPLSNEGFAKLIRSVYY